jgi:hypothetical protein
MSNMDAGIVLDLNLARWYVYRPGESKNGGKDEK